jgi:CBS domain-containing protein
MRNRPVSEVIRRRHAITLPPTATVQEAGERMRDERVGAVLVTGEGGELLGIFTGRDAVCRMVAQGRSARRTKLSDAMTLGPAVLPPDASAMEALRLMQDGGFRHVPILEGGRVVGIVSRGDFRGLEHARLDEETGFFEVLR